MPNYGKILALYGSLTLVLTLVFNITPSWPRLPWDFELNKGPVKFYIPWLTSMVISVVLTVMFNYFK